MKSLNHIKEEDILLLERYFDDDLNEKEIDVFFQRLEEDEIFNQQFEAFRLAHEESIKLFEESEVIAKNQSAKIVDLKRNQFIHRTTTWLSVAASVAIMLVIPFLFQSRSDVGGAIKIAEEQTANFNTDGLTLTIRSKANEEAQADKEILKEIAIAYKTNNHQLLLDLASNLETTPDLELFKAWAMIGLGNFENAESVLLNLLETKEGQISSTYWGLVTISLKKENWDKAKVYLKELSKPGSVSEYAYGHSGKKAKEALSKIN